MFRVPSRSCRFLVRARTVVELQIAGSRRSDPITRPRGLPANPAKESTISATEKNLGGLEGAARPTSGGPSPSRKRGLLIGAGVAAVALAVGCSVGIPAIVHASQVSAYHDTFESLQAAIEQTNEDFVAVEAAEQLAEIAAPAAYTLAEQVAALSRAGEPTFTKADAEALGTAAKDAKIEQVDAPKKSDLKIAFDAQAQADKDAATKAQKEEKDAPDPTVPAHLLDLSADQAVSVLDVTPEKAPTQKVADGKVNGKTVETAKAQLVKAEKAAKQAATALETAKGVLDELSVQVDTLLPALAAAGEHSPAQAKVAIEAYPKAPQGDKDAVTSAAATAEQTAKDTQTTSSEQYASVQAYAAAVAQLKAGHDAQVQAEAEAAAQAAAEQAAAEQAARYQYVPPQNNGGNYYQPQAPFAPVPPSGGGGHVGGNIGGQNPDQGDPNGGCYLGPHANCAV